MYRVNDGWDVGEPCGQTPQHTGLSAVGVNDVRFLFAEQQREMAQRQRIVPWANGSDKFRDDGEQVGTVCEERFKRTFGASGWAADEVAIHSVAFAKAEHTCHGVFLRTANNQSRDDMRDAHRCSHSSEIGHALDVLCLWEHVQWHDFLQLVYSIGAEQLEVARKCGRMT